MLKKTPPGLSPWNSMLGFENHVQKNNNSPSFSFKKNSRAHKIVKKITDEPKKLVWNYNTMKLMKGKKKDGNENENF